jgi:ubiquitin conjugation factor E4 B
MVQVLTVLMPRGKGGRLQPTRVSPFDSNFVVANLGPALTHLYCDVERTGSASQFYDRLNARHELSSILVFLWTDRPGHKEAIVAYWDQHPESFKSFADKLLNDSIFLLDEGLSKLFEARGAQQRLEAGMPSSESERRELKETMDRASRQTVSYMVLLKESLRIFSMIALNHPRLFMHADMHERLATSLNYCLYQVHGPRRSELSFPNPEKFQFEPAWIVDKLCSSILSFATFDKSFVDFLVRDTRSYSEELYSNAAAFLERHTEADFDFKPTQWRAMSQLAREHTQQVEEFEDQLGDIPDEFLDPLMATLMTDPVILPSSRITLDRQVIERALLADPIDPYNRSPLTADQLIPDTELKQKIDAFIAEKRRKK